MSSSKPLIFSHKNCWDGAMAAYAFMLRYGKNVEIHFVQYHDPIPVDVTDRDLIVVDFCFDVETTLELYKKAKSLVVLDHHPEAAVTLRKVTDRIKVDFDERMTYRDSGEDNFVFAGSDTNNHILALLIHDKMASGAMLAWRQCFPKEIPPRFIQFADDYDRWVFALPETKAFMAGLGRYPIDAKVYYDVFARAEAVDEIITAGKPVAEFRDSVVQGTIKMTKRMVKVTMPDEALEKGFQKEYIVPCANAPKMFVSEIGHELCKTHPQSSFSLVYYDGPRGRAYRLTSLKGDPISVNVGKLAKFFNGGGHVNAAGVVHTECVDLFPQVS